MMDYRRWNSVSVLAGVIVVVINLIQGDVAFAIILLVLLGPLLGGLLAGLHDGDETVPTAVTGAGVVIGATERPV